MRVQRLVLALVAVAAAAWLVIGYRDARLLGDATSVVLRAHPSQTEIGSALGDVRDARLLNPDLRSPLGLRATLNVRRGSPAAARAALLELVRREPENAEAWALLAAVTARIDPSLSARAERRVRQLDPEVSRR